MFLCSSVLNEVPRKTTLTGRTPALMTHPPLSVIEQNFFFLKYSYALFFSFFFFTISAKKPYLIFTIVNASNIHYHSNLRVS